MSISSKTQERLKHDNPRQLKGKKYKKLHDDLKQFGDLSGVVYNVTTRQTIGGNQRSTVFDIGECTFEFTHENSAPDEQGTLKLGYVIWRGNRYGYREVAWPKETEDAACLIANIGAGEWDWDRLAAYDAEILQIAGMDAELLKTLENDERNLRALLEAANEQAGDADAEPQIDRAAELNEKWQVKSGDLWRIGEHRLLCGDSTRLDDVARVMGGEKAGACVTDPPYNVAYSSLGSNKDAWGEIENDDMSEEDFYKWLVSIGEMIDFSLGNGASIYLCHGDTDRKSIPFIDLFSRFGWKRSSTIIWYKNSASMGWQDYRSQHECISYGWKQGAEHYFIDDRSQTTIWEINRDSQNTYSHPTQKPVELFTRAITNSTRRGCVVFEPFAGSGTTLVACQNLNRKCRAIEISPNYCAVILERMTTAFPALAIHRVEA